MNDCLNWLAVVELKLEKQSENDEKKAENYLNKH
jgi:hypothetical protein